MKQHRLYWLAAFLVLTGGPASADAPGHLEGYVPAVARVQGRFASYWTSDLWIYQQGASAIHLWFNREDQDNTDQESIVVPLDGSVTRIEDVVGSLFHTEGIGSVHYLADGPVSVVSRTWTTAPDGGSFGQTIRGVSVGQASIAGTGQAGALRVMVDQEPGFRANLGLVNVSGVPLTVAVDMFTSDGEAAPGGSSFEVGLEPYGMTQVGDILKRLDPGTRDGIVIRTGVTSEDGAVLVYLSTVDNRTNDPSYQEGFRFGY
jgi:hypothetical protein